MSCTDEVFGKDKVQLFMGSQLVWSNPVWLMASMACAIELSIMVIAAQNHCAISVAAGFSMYRALLLCSAMRQSGPS